jgi:hypothetical protein
MPEFAVTPAVVAHREPCAPAAPRPAAAAAPPETARAATPPQRRDDALAGVLRRSVLQRRKTVEERARQQSDKALATRTIGLLRNNLKQASDDHLFLGVPLDPVGPIAPAHPVGIHAYTANGTLPAGVVQVARRFSTGKVHQIKWHWHGQPADTAKPSTMFPSWMPPDHVRALIQLAYPNSCITPLATLAGLPHNASRAAINEALHSDATKRYITRNTDIALQQLGSGTLKSYYPVDPPGEFP